MNEQISEILDMAVKSSYNMGIENSAKVLDMTYDLLLKENGNSALAEMVLILAKTVRSIKTDKE